MVRSAVVGCHPRFVAMIRELLRALEDNPVRLALAIRPAPTSAPADAVRHGDAPDLPLHRSRWGCETSRGLRAFPPSATEISAVPLTVSRRPQGFTNRIAPWQGWEKRGDLIAAAFAGGRAACMFFVVLSGSRSAVE